MYIVEVVASCVSAAEVAGLSLWPQGEGGHVVDAGRGGESYGFTSKSKVLLFRICSIQLAGLSLRAF